MATKRGVIPETIWQSAIRFRNPRANPRFGNTAGRKLYLGRDASNYVNKLNGYQRQQVEQTIMSLAGVPLSPGSIASRSRPAFFKAVKTRVGAGEFVVKYWMTSDVVVVSEVIPTIARKGKDVVVFKDMEFGGQLSGANVAGGGGHGSESAAGLINGYLQNKSDSTSTKIIDGKVKAVKIGKNSRIAVQEVDILKKSIANVFNSGADGAKLAGKLSADNPLTIILNDKGLHFGAFWPNGDPARLMTIDISRSGGIRFINKSDHSPSKSHHFVRSTLTRSFAHESAHTVLGISNEDQAVQFADRVEARIWGEYFSTVRKDYSNSKWY